VISIIASKDNTCRINGSAGFLLTLRLPGIETEVDYLLGSWIKEQAVQFEPPE